MYFADLTTYSYLRNNEEIPGVLNIGWLDIRYPFTKGDVLPVYIEKLAEIILTKRTVLLARGRHDCEFCIEIPKVVSEDNYVPLGCSEIWIPAENNIIYAAPNMIHHYIVAHHYQPPQVFLDALLKVEFPPDWGEKWVWNDAFKRLGIHTRLE
jgi:hypothetical protein